LIALNAAASASDIPVILLPFGPLNGKVLEEVVSRLTNLGHLIVVPAGNEGTPGLVSPSIAGTALVAEGIEPDGKKSSFSSKVPGSLGAIGDLPTVVLTDAGPTVALGSGTSNAAAVLAAIAAETVSRQPDLREAELRKALIASARPPEGDVAPIARVAIPR
jgi:Subtilase family